MLSDYFHRDEQIEEYLERYNEEFEEQTEIEARYRRVFDLFQNMELEKGSRAWKKADFYTMFIELDRSVNRLGIEGDPADVRQRLVEFFAQVAAVRDSDTSEPLEGNVGEYFRATLQSTNDRGPRTTRGRVIRALIAGEKH